VKFSGAIDHVVTQYEVASGAIVHAEGTWAMTPGFGFNMSYTVNFERATADYDIARGKESLRVAEEGQGSKIIACEGADGYIGELRHFIECVRAGRPPTVVTAADGLASVEICEAEERSVKERRVIDV
jgi:predicted dehydrogenase